MVGKIIAIAFSTATALLMGYTSFKYGQLVGPQHLTFFGNLKRN